MDKVVGSRKRIPLGKYTTYELALAAKRSEVRYRPEELQIRHKHDGYHLVARVVISGKEKING